MKYESLVMHLKAECKGRKNAKKASELEHSLSISANELRRRVNRLRREGVPISSSADGYYYAVTAGEVYSTIRQLRAMANGLEAAIVGLENALNSFGENEGGEGK
ncbi:MAG: hypothetical protein HFH26_07370 [Clostridiaceae bacterium]|nr:hypothetical protein [Clostridiaceae bacterium]